MPPDGAAGQLPTKNLILAGEPETFSDYAHPYHMVSKRQKGLSKFIKLWSYSYNSIIRPGRSSA